MNDKTIQNELLKVMDKIYPILAQEIVKLKRQHMPKNKNILTTFTPIPLPI